jgi:small subunit ribosomal protein S6
MERMSRRESKEVARIAVDFPKPDWQNRRQYGAKQNFAERSNRMNRTYEIMFIVRPDVEEAELDKLIEGFSANVTNGGGEVKSVEKMGRRRLAYTVRKFNDGFYVLLNVAAAGSLITEIERRLRVSEQVIKFITVRMDEEEKRLAKVKAIRDTKVKRSTQPIAHAQAPAAEVAHASEAEPAAAAPVEHVAAEAAAPAV